ncbi:MAG: membrane protein insertase YidC, partial [Prevotella sp.]|nr:membrane protein insertase YidC [Prevotella sp.]
MNRDTLIGFVLIALVLIGFSWYNQPSQKEMEAYQRQQDSIAAIQQDKETKKAIDEAERRAKAEEAAKGDTTALFYAALNGQNSPVVLKNEKVELTFDTKGGTIAKAVIKGFKNADNSKDEVTLFDEKTQQMNFMLAGKQDNIITRDLYFTPSNQTDSTVTMTAQAGNGGTITLDYCLGQDYLLHFTLQAQGLAGIFAPNYKEMDIEWSDMARQQERGFMFENRYSTLTYKEKDGGTDYLSETSEKIDEKIDETLDWVAFKNQFFSAALIAKDDFQGGSLMTSIPQEKGTGYLKQFGAKLKTAFDPTGVRPSEFEMYIGPND